MKRPTGRGTILPTVDVFDDDDDLPIDLDASRRTGQPRRRRKSVSSRSWMIVDNDRHTTKPENSASSNETTTTTTMNTPLSFSSVAADDDNESTNNGDSDYFSLDTLECSSSLRSFSTNNKINLQKSIYLSIDVHFAYARNSRVNDAEPSSSYHDDDDDVRSIVFQMLFFHDNFAMTTLP